MEALLEDIVKTNSRVAIIDITGVPTVDTVVAQHLLKTVTAARLMGADCIISGVRPQIAQTIVHLGINLLDVTTKATLSDAFALALERTGLALEHLEERIGVFLEKIPILRMGEFLLVTIQVDMHDRLAMTLQEDLTTRISETGATWCIDRYFESRNRGLVHWPHVRQYRGDVASAGRSDRGCGHAAGGGDYAGGIGLSLPGVRTALNVDAGMEILRQAP